MNILFFDVVPTNIVRFFDRLVDELRKHKDVHVFFLIEEDDHNTLAHVDSAYRFAEFTGYVKRRSVSWFTEFMLSHQIDALFINAQRIPDDMVVLSARCAGVPTFMLQHGMYIPFLKRDAKFFVSKVGKTLRFLKYAQEISRHLYGNSWLGVLKYIKCFVFGRNQVDEKIDRSLLNVDRVYVYGEYWKEFHAEQFGYDRQRQLVVGYPELIDLQKTRSLGKKKGSVCYIAQTLVEDGRLKRGVQERFFSALVDECQAAHKQLLIKLHPRSDLSLFSYAKDKAHVEFWAENLPFAEKYVGHYSTLIVKGFKLSGDVFLHEYPGHPTPNYFSGLATTVSREIHDLTDWLRSEEKADFPVDYFFCENDYLYENLVTDFWDIVSRSKARVDVN